MSSHEPTEYNEYVGQETVKCEYKEFTFNLVGLALENKLAEQYCRTNQFDFNTNVIANLKKYFQVYLGKYACGFFNSGIDGDCWIGINNYGFVKGIPFKGPIDKNLLKKTIKETLKQTVKNNTNQINWEQLVKIKIKKVSYNFNRETLPENITFSNYLVGKEKFDTEYAEFIKQIELWRNRMGFSAIKLVDLVNNPETRSQIIQYIKLTDPINPVIKLLETDYVLKYKSHKDIIQIKKNPLEPYYWVTRWKDIIVDSLKLEKPTFTNCFNSHNTPINLLTSANEMIPYWITYNSNMNLYIIQINFSGSEFSINTADFNELFSSNFNQFEYLDSQSRKWNRCYRTVLANGDPVCLPL
jgi:hypothetical protein